MRESTNGAGEHRRYRARGPRLHPAPGLVAVQAAWANCATVLIQGSSRQGLSQTVICKQAGASPIIRTDTSGDGARLEAAKALGADHLVGVKEKHPFARIVVITAPRTSTSPPAPSGVRACRT